MSAPSALDDAYEAMQAKPDDDRAMLRFYERLADNELFLALEHEPQGDDDIKPLIFHTEGQQFALVFDSAERLAEFAEKTVPYIALSGRLIANTLSGQGVGLGVNLMVSPSSTLLGSDIVDWLASSLGEDVKTLKASPITVSSPSAIPEELLEALDQKLALMQGLATCAYLAQIAYDDGSNAHSLVFVDALEQAEDAITAAISEALAFSGIGAGWLDVMFIAGTSALIEKLEAQGLKFDLPDPLRADAYMPQAPGMDPNKPPKLK